MLLSIMIFQILIVQMKRLTCFARYTGNFFSLFLLISPACFLTALCNQMFICFYNSVQIGVDCPRTVPDVSFFQQAEVQKSLERILYIWLVIFFSD